MGVDRRRSTQCVLSTIANMILPKVRDPRLITVRRGGSLQDDDHRLLAVWAADCAQHVLHHFEQARPRGRPSAPGDRAGARLGAG